MRMTCLPLIAVMLGACASAPQPYIAYENPSHPLAQTAVLSVADLQGRLGVVEVTRVDGRETTCAEAGCPVWVRVLPGRHTFNVRITSRGAYIVSNEYLVDVVFMASGHVYVLDSLPGQPEGIGVHDLGYRPDYSVMLGSDGADKQRFPVKFE